MVDEFGPFGRRELGGLTMMVSQGNGSRPVAGGVRGGHGSLERTWQRHRGPSAWSVGLRLVRTDRATQVETYERYWTYPERAERQGWGAPRLQCRHRCPATTARPACSPTGGQPLHDQADDSAFGDGQRSVVRDPAARQAWLGCSRAEDELAVVLGRSAALGAADPRRCRSPHHAVGPEPAAGGLGGQVTLPSRVRRRT